MATAVQPALKELLSDPAKYPDAMEYTDTAGKKTTLGDLRKGVVSIETPASPNEATDKRVSEILEAGKKKKLRPAEARIGELTAKAAKLEQDRLNDKKEFETKLAEQNEKNIKAELDRRTAEAAANDKRPVREDFPGDANGTTTFTAKMAEWVIRQQDKIVAKPVAAEVMAPAADPAKEAELKKDYDGFLEAGHEFIKRNVDFNDVLQKATERGLTIQNAAMMAIIRLKAPQVAYYLAKVENDAVARNFMKLDDVGQIMEVGRIAERLTARPEDFVSNAGPAGRRLTGGAAAGVAETDPDKMDTDTYLMQRRADIKAGKRRR